MVFVLLVPIVSEMNRRTTVLEQGPILFIFASRWLNDVHYVLGH
jgi:hypothetical protein